MLRTGDLFQAKYRVKLQLGAGSFGEVYLVSHERVPESELALKVIRPPPAAALDYRRRFLQEVRIGCRLRSPHIVTVRDFDVTEDGLLYFAMDRVPGTPLDVLLSSAPTTPWRRAFAIIRQVLVALDEAHALGVIHRDVKPGNILVEERDDGSDFVRVLDFGIARISGGAALTGDWMGTPQYMAPEQCRTPDAIDGRVDLYACGVVLFEMIVGHRPFRAPDPLEILLLHRNTPPVPLREARPELEIPADVDALVLHALEKSADARFGSAAEMIGAIDAVLAGAAPASAEAHPPAAVTVDPLASLGRPDDEPTRASGPQVEVPPTVRAPVDRARFFVGARVDRIYATPRLRIAVQDPSGEVRGTLRDFEVDATDFVAGTHVSDLDTAGGVIPGARRLLPTTPVCEVLLYASRVCLRDTSERGIRIDGEPVPRGPLVFLPSRFRLEIPGTPIDLKGRVHARRPGDEGPGALRLEAAEGGRTTACVWLLDEALVGPEDGPIPLFDDDELGAILRVEDGAIEVLTSADAERFLPLLAGDSMQVGGAVLLAGD